MSRRLVVVIAAGAFLACVFAGARADDWPDIDSCLDAGGAWDYERQNCRYE